MTTSPPFPTTIPTPTTTSKHILGTLFGGYVRVRAGTGKQGGTGDSAWIPPVVVLLLTGENGHRLYKSDYTIKSPATNVLRMLHVSLAVIPSSHMAECPTTMPGC